MHPLDALGPVIAALGGLAVLWWGRACRAGTFPKNAVVGYRTRASMQSTAAWVAAHRGSAPALIGSGVLLTAAGVTSIGAVLLGVPGMAGPVLTAGIVVLLLGLILGGVLAHRALRRHLGQN